MKKKIVIFLEKKDDDIVVTGGENQLVQMIKGLKRHNYKVYYLSIKQSFNKLPELIHEYHEENIYVISDYSKRFTLLISNFAFKRKFKIKVICTVGGFYFDYRKSKIKNFIDYIVSYFYLNPADLILTTGIAVENRLIKMGIHRKKIVNIYPAIRDSLLSESFINEDFKQTTTEKIILTVGRFHPVKGYDFLLDAASLCSDLQDLHFIIVGDYMRQPDSYYKYIKERIKNEGLDNKVTIYGRTKSDKELAALYKKCWCYLHTSVWESSPITVCEPLLFGKPVIATNVGGTSEYLKNGCDSILIPAKSGVAICSAIKKIYSDESLYYKLKEGAISESKKFQCRKWNDVGEEYFNAINSI